MSDDERMKLMSELYRVLHTDQQEEFVDLLTSARMAMEKLAFQKKEIERLESELKVCRAKAREIEHRVFSETIDAMSTILDSLRDHKGGRVPYEDT